MRFPLRSGAMCSIVPLILPLSVTVAASMVLNALFIHQLDQFCLFVCSFAARF